MCVLGWGGGRGEGERCHLLVHVHLVENIIFRLLNFFYYLRYLYEELIMTKN